MSTIPGCLNCERPATAEDLLITYRGKVVGAVCADCTRDVKKPRVTLTRAHNNEDFTAEQYICVEVFR